MTGRKKPQLTHEGRPALRGTSPNNMKPLRVVVEAQKAADKIFNSPSRSTTKKGKKKG